MDQAPLIIAPVAYKSGAVARLSNTMADTDLVFSKFESLCQSVGPARCALAGQGPVATRMNQLLAQLLRAPIPAPSATPPGQLMLQAIGKYLAPSQPPS